MTAFQDQPGACNSEAQRPGQLHLDQWQAPQPQSQPHTKGHPSHMPTTSLPTTSHHSHFRTPPKAQYVSKQVGAVTKHQQHRHRHHWPAGLARLAVLCRSTARARYASAGLLRPATTRPLWAGGTHTHMQRTDSYEIHSAPATVGHHPTLCMLSGWYIAVYNSNVMSVRQALLALLLRVVPVVPACGRPRYKSAVQVQYRR